MIKTIWEDIDKEEIAKSVIQSILDGLKEDS